MKTARALLHAHINHGLEHAQRKGTQGADDTSREFKALTNYLEGVFA